MMLKTIEAVLRGYVLFTVENRQFWTYGAARKAQEAVPQYESVTFAGFHILKGWRVFYMRAGRDRIRYEFDLCSRYHTQH